MRRALAISILDLSEILDPGQVKLMQDFELFDSSNDLSR